MPVASEPDPLLVLTHALERISLAFISFRPDDPELCPALPYRPSVGQNPKVAVSVRFCLKDASSCQDRVLMAVEDMTVEAVESVGCTYPYISILLLVYGIYCRGQSLFLGYACKYVVLFCGYG